ncbi:MAG: bacteriocin immunity protein, partial [Enterococcus sp.]
MRTTEELLRDIYNLILNPSTREWERYLLMNTKDALENRGNQKEQLAKLEMELRPLATRNNLTPDVSDFYQRLIGNDVKVTTLNEHQIQDPHFQERTIFAGGCFWCMVEPFETQ